MNPWFLWIPLVVIVGTAFLIYMSKRNRDDRANRGTTAKEDLKNAEEPENRP